jgi:hypothetical protein
MQIHLAKEKTSLKCAHTLNKWSQSERKTNFEHMNFTLRLKAIKLLYLGTAGGGVASVFPAQKVPERVKYPHVLQLSKSIQPHSAGGT